MASVSEPLTSEDGRVALAQVNWTAQADALPEGSAEAVQAAAETARDAGLQVEFGGDAVVSEASIGGVGEIIGLAVAALVLADHVRLARRPPGCRCSPR